MAKEVVLLISILVLFLSLREALGIKKSYVVYLGGHTEENLAKSGLVIDSHHELLGSVLGSNEAAKESIFYSYTASVNGFAALLEEEHALAVSRLPGVLSVFPNKARKLHTTDSWRFLGLVNQYAKADTEDIPHLSLWRKTHYGKDVIIANLDTGVWPEAESFRDKGYGPIPSRWRGSCQNGTKFAEANCNRKLIGAKYFIKGYEAEKGPLDPHSGEFLSPRDSNGHGSHTLSTAGGNFVKKANIFGYAEGNAKGGAPHARVATYKVCWPAGDDCYAYEADIIAGYDAGVYDGVDVFSISLGAVPPLADFFQDGIAIGAFHAVQRGKVVVCSAGNSGPTPGTVANVAPWIMTVGASSIDRKFVSNAFLGNKKTYKGQSLSKFSLQKRKMYPLVSSMDVRAPGANESAGKYCLLGSLDPHKVKGKIVACLMGVNARVEKGEAVLMAGGVGMILCNPPNVTFEEIADSHVLPTTHLSGFDGAAVFDYMNSTLSPVAYIAPPRTVLGTKPAPFMAAFSSKGPNSLTPDILKPDITAPGLNILAAFSKAASPSGLPFDRRHIAFNVMSGTSMSCPHVAGVAALLKAAHSNWSPAAIRSAIMTTATEMDNSKGFIKEATLDRASPFSYGAGQIYPNRASSPGLVYDLSVRDYYTFFCSYGYNSSQITAITGKQFSCPQEREAIYNLNYPSITVSELKGPLYVRRTVTYVSEGPAIFEAKVRSPHGVVVAVKPNKLVFSKMGEKKSFFVVMKPKKSLGEDYVFGYFTLKDSKHVVRSPIVVRAAKLR